MNPQSGFPFNVRVYGILIENGSVLISDELHLSRKITKFPGGGLQFGEGTTDALKREFREELHMEIRIDKHFYTVDFFQESAFNPNHQVISIYYQVSRLDETAIHVVEKSFDFAAGQNQVFRWISLAKIKENDFTFPIDQHVCGMLLA